MKFYRNGSSIKMCCCSLLLLWMALFIDASEEENNIIMPETLDDHILQNTQQDDVKTVNFEKFTNEEVKILANMERDVLYDTIQALQQERVKSTLAQPTMSNDVQNHGPIDTTAIVSASLTSMDNHYKFIFAIETNPYKYMLMNYLTLRDIISFGFTCKTLYMKVFEQNETQTLRRFCTLPTLSHI